jgi:glutamine amidotransferase
VEASIGSFFGTMCRWITLLSADPVSLSDIVLAPSNSLVQLAKDASFHPEFTDTNNHAMNGDGFGVGWYHSNVAICPHLNGGNNFLHDEPRAAVFKDTQPAWNNVNLKEICLATRSHCIIAHVRAASAGTGVSQANCHPFKCGRLLFCHNGRIDSYSKIKRHFINQVIDEMFYNMHGTTDSECIFALLLTHLAKDGGESPMTQTTPFGHKRLVSALKKTLRQIEKLLLECDIVTGFSTCNFSLTDGDTVVVTRFCDKSPEVPPPSLYFAYGNAQHLYQELTSDDPVLFVQQLSEGDSEHGGSAHGDGTDSDVSVDFIETTVDLGTHLSLPGTVYADVEPSEASFIVASNPLTKTHTWHPMPKNSVMWCTRGSHPELRLLKGRPSTVSHNSIEWTGSI